MLLPSSALLLAALASATAAAASPSTSHSRSFRTPVRRTYDTHTYYALELPESADESAAAAAAAALGTELVEPLGELAGHWLVRRRGLAVRSASAVGGADPVVARYEQLRDRSHARRGLGVPSVRSLQLLEPRQRTKRVPPPPERRSRVQRPHSFKRWDETNAAMELESRDDTELLFFQNDLGMKDPMLHKQWHLANQVDSQWELNISHVWKEGITGKGVKVAIVDDGLDHEHEDLHANYFAEGSWDFNDHDASPAPRLADDQHGTRCAGEIGAVANDVCGVGVAYESKIAGLRILSGSITDADEASALNYRYQENDIYSCSWGPPDDGSSMEGPTGVILKSFINGVQKGRGGKGSIFVFAAGNGGGYGDQCNFDGYTNSIFSVTVGAYDHLGKHPFYSEMCSAMLIVAPSSGSQDYIHTTDINGKCAHNHGGTSAAAPIAAGVIALALQARPDLGWRDVQHIAVNYAVQIHHDDEDWEKTAAGRNYSYKYGYGKLDAGRFIDAARTWKLVKPQAWFDTPKVVLPYTKSPKRPSPDVSGGDAPLWKRQDAGMDKPVDVVVPETGSFITDTGVTSTYEVTQKMLDNANFERLEHVTVRVWIDHDRRGDVEVELVSPNGIKSVLARSRKFDDASSGYDGWKFMTLKHWDENPVGTWTITVRDPGNPEKQGRFQSWSLQLWGEAADASKATPWRVAEYGEEDEEQVGTEHTTAPGPEATSALSASMTTKKIKPTALLPGDHGEAEGTVRPTGSPDPEPSADADNEDEEGHPVADQGMFDGIDTLRSHSAWLAGAFLIVLLAALGVGGFFLLRERRRRARLGGYAPVDDGVQLSLLERGRRVMGRDGERSRRAEESKELYDAFGDGPSDSEDETTALTYHDKFLEDDEDHHPHASGSGSGSGVTERDEDDDDHPEPPVYRDDPEDAPHPTTPPAESNTSSGSWQDAGEDVHR